jgi:predicted molibdopterin-dependent oxidoreductase YjgC
MEILPLNFILIRQELGSLELNNTKKNNYMDITISIDATESKYLVQNIARALNMRNVEDEEARVALGNHLASVISGLAIRGEEMRLDELEKETIKAAILKITVT